MTTILPLLAIGSLAFWIALAVLSIIIVASLEEDSYGLSVFATIVFALAFGISLTTLPLFYIILGVAGYGVFGGTWSVWRWHRHTRRLIAKAKEGVELQRKGYSRGYTRKIEESDFDLTQNKARITAWIAYWPWSLTWEFTGGIFRNIFDMLRGVYESIGNKAKAELKEINAANDELKN